MYTSKCRMLVYIYLLHIVNSLLVLLLVIVVSCATIYRRNISLERAIVINLVFSVCASEVFLDNYVIVGILIFV